ncbi:MAG: CPBP family intramembrane metalloprotease [Armatimonadetes bacterium]|nr:CPBP family intramembrane metalloprotease [Armatimonadota bacterium]
MKSYPKPILHAILLFSFLLLASTVTYLQRWPLPLLFPLLLSSLLVWTLPNLRYRPDWLCFGHVYPSLIALTVAALLLSPALILTWYRLTSPNLSALSSQIPVGNIVVLTLAGGVFALVNSILEEVLFRGILQQALSVQMGANASWAVQGVIFGTLHANGVPQGVVGMALASLFGIVLGWIRYKSNGIGLCCIVHFITDAVIFTLLAVARNG